MAGRLAEKEMQTLGETLGELEDKAPVVTIFQTCQEKLTQIKPRSSSTDWLKEYRSEGLTLSNTLPVVKTEALDDKLAVTLKEVKLDTLVTLLSEIRAKALTHTLAATL